jgi:large subunit ribosomal protein L25
MSKRLLLKAKTREILGRKVRSLRREGLVPASVYGKKVKAISLQISLLDFRKLYHSVGETTLFDLLIETEKTPRPVLIKAVQYHPVTNLPLHVDFHQVSLTEKVSAKIPVEVVGVSPAVTDLGGVMIMALSEIEVEALPTDLPEKIEVDISALVNLDNSILVKDLKIEADKITVLSGPDETVVTVQTPKEDVVEAAPAEAAADSAPVEAETTVQGKSEEKTEDQPKDTKKSE